MLKDITPPAVFMGTLAAFTGFAASFSIVIAGLTASGASFDQMATGLFFATLSMGLCSLWLPFLYKIPAAVAWSTPAAAYLAAITTPAGGFAQVVGALCITAFLLLLTGLIPALGRLVGALPKPLASALLAGVLFPLCLAPTTALSLYPLMMAPIIAAWALGLWLHRLAPMPLATLAFLIVVALFVEFDADITWQLPSLTPIVPVFEIGTMLSLALPLYLVTMAGQNLPGFAVLDSFGYQTDRKGLLMRTGLLSCAAAPFGSIPVNMSAITAAMMAGEDADPDPNKRYIAAMMSGAVYIALALLAGAITQVMRAVPVELLTGLAGLALLPALTSSLRSCFDTPSRFEACGVCFLVTASGVSYLGLSGAVWGLLAGLVMWMLKR